jgi:transcriptional regulator of met regulon
MQSIVSHLEKIPISLSTLRQAAPKWCRVLLYDNLPATRERLFSNRYKCAIILYTLHDARGRLRKDQVGHYSLIMQTKTGKLAYFSSYGMRPEQEINITKSKPGKILKILGKDYFWSRRALQKRRDAESCGLHCLARAYLYKLKEADYYKIIGSRFTTNSADDMVSILTLLLVSNELQ